jgi:hypothetical protein
MSGVTSCGSEMLVDLDDSNIQSAGFEQTVREIKDARFRHLAASSRICLGTEMSLKGGDQ